MLIGPSLLILMIWMIKTALSEEHERAVTQQIEFWSS